MWANAAGVVFVLAVDEIALLDLVALAFAQLNDADVDAAFFSAVADVTPALVGHRLNGNIAAAGVGVVLPLVAGREVLCCASVLFQTSLIASPSPVTSLTNLFFATGSASAPWRPLPADLPDCCLMSFHFLWCAFCVANQSLERLKG